MSFDKTPPPAAPSPAPAAAPAKASNGLGIAALILGLAAVLVALIPIVGMFLVWVPALVGIGLGIAAVLKKSAKKVVAWIGLGLSIVSIFVAFATAAAGVGAVSNAINEASASAAAAAPKEIVYSVTGDGGTANITYSSWSNGSWGSQSANGASLPWSQTITPEASTGWSSFSSFSIFAMGTADTTTLGCTITVDGTVVSTQTSTGPFASVTCSQSSY